MKVILSGYQGSKHIISASAYLASQHLKGFEVIFLNYGEFTGDLFGAKYVSLKEEQTNGSQDWSKDIREYLETLDDEKVIFSLDDYFLDSDIDMELFNSVLNLNYCCLCADSMDNQGMYSVTTQYTLWNREFLIEVLGEVNTPWEFELKGSEYYNSLHVDWKCVPALKYPANSALSGRWGGVRTYGRDIKYL